MPESYVVYRHREAGRPLTELADYRRAGGYEALRKALHELDRDEAVYQFVRSGLRGRGGAGFPMGRKASFIPKDSALPAYVVCNADESEPGTFKDRELMEDNPFQLLEGDHDRRLRDRRRARLHLHPRRVRAPGARPRVSAIAQARAAGLLGTSVMRLRLRLRHHALPRRGRLHLRRGDGAAREPGGQARPAAAQAAVPGGRRPLRLARRSSTTSRPSPRCRRSSSAGADWYAGVGTEKSTGTKVFSISGHVVRPGNYEIVMGDTTLRELVYDIAGGFRPGRDFAAAWVGGSSVNVVGAEALDTPLDYESLAAAGTSLGSAGCIVMDDSGSIVRSTPAPGPLLPPRVVRQVHALPRGHALAGADPPADRRRRGPHGGPGADRVARRRASTAGCSAPWPTRGSSRC